MICPEGPGGLECERTDEGHTLHRAATEWSFVTWGVPDPVRRKARKKTAAQMKIELIEGVHIAEAGLMSGPTLFDGVTIDPALDNARLITLMDRVTVFMGDNQWHTLGEIADRCNGSEASVSARLRDLRKEWHGNRHVSRERVKDAPGLWQYRLDPL